MAHEWDLRHVSFEGKPVASGRRRESAPVTARPCTAPAGQADVAVARPATATGDCPAGFARWVLGRAGLDGQAYRSESLRRRIPACVRAMKARSEGEAALRLAAHPEMLDAAVSALLIGVTRFFRDAEVFEGLRTRVLPILRERAGPLRIWSAGCASGAEICSFAMLLDEAGLLARAHLLGTDCRVDVIEDARRASYGADPTRTVAGASIAAYFEPTADGAWRPVERLRRRLRWRVADVLCAAEPGPWDVILWRNAAIYLNPGDAASVCGRLAAELSPGGFLVVGKAEQPPAAVGLLPVSRCVYRKRGA